MAVATSGRTVALVATVLCVAVSGSACSTPPPRSPAPATGSAPAASGKPAGTPPPPAGTVAAGRAICIGPVPAGWASLSGAHSVATPDGLAFTVDAVAGDTAFGQYQSATASGVGELDLATGRLTRISTYPGQIGGVGWMSVEAPWLVWEQLDSRSELRDWSVHAWNQSTGAASVLATSHQPDGSLVQGPQPLPVLRNGRVAWAQPVPGGSPGTVISQLRVVDLASGTATVVANGRLSSPVFAGRYLVWATVAGQADFALGAVDADTLHAAALPALPGSPGPIGQLAGAPDYLVWSTQDSTGLVVWRWGSAQYDRFSSDDGVHFFQFMRVAGHFLVWFAGGTSSVLDLTTGNGFDVSGTVTGSADSVVLAQPVGQAGGKAALVASRVSRIAVGAAPSIAGCR